MTRSERHGGIKIGSHPKEGDVPMKHYGSLKSSFVLFTLLFLLFEDKAYAYLDLGTGSYVIQIIIGTLVGVCFAAKGYLKRIRIFFSKLFRKGRVDESEND